MGVPSDRLMELMKSQGGQPATPMPGGGQPDGPTSSLSDSDTPPMSSPMSTPEPKMGTREGAMVNLSMALDLIEQSLPALGSESEEGRAALAAIKSIGGLLGPRKGKAGELQQSEILQLLQTLPQAGGASPEARAISQAPIPGAPSGMPQGMPQGMPPGMPQGMPQPPQGM